MTSEEANKMLSSKKVKQIHFEEHNFYTEILSIEFTDGTFLDLNGGYNGEVEGSIRINNVSDHIH